MRKTFFLIPGFRTQINDDMYSWLVFFLAERGYIVKPVPVVWSRKTLSQNSKEFLQYFEQHKSEENYLLGFSYGAVIALMTVTITKPKKMYLCSLSPDFAEDSNDMPIELQQYIGKRRFLDTKTRSGRNAAKQLMAETIIFYGEKEGIQYPPIKKRAEETVKLAAKARLVVMPHTPHKIDFPAYQEAIKLEILR